MIFASFPATRLGEDSSRSPAARAFAETSHQGKEGLQQWLFSFHCLFIEHKSCVSTDPLNLSVTPTPSLRVRGPPRLSSQPETEQEPVNSPPAGENPFDFRPRDIL